jgi:hypothetical protein
MRLINTQPSIPLLHVICKLHIEALKEGYFQCNLNFYMFSI